MRCGALAGGELQIIAKFEEQSIRISQLKEFDNQNAEAAPKLPDTIVSANAGMDSNLRLEVFETKQPAVPQQANVWTGGERNTERSRTPSANTTTPAVKTAKAA